MTPQSRGAGIGHPLQGIPVAAATINVLFHSEFANDCVRRKLLIWETPGKLAPARTFGPLSAAD